MVERASNATSEDRWDSLDIWLHRIIVARGAVKYLVAASSKGKMYDAANNGSDGRGGLLTLGKAEIAGGSLVLIAALVRLFDRYTRERRVHYQFGLETDALRRMMPRHGRQERASLAG